jgi:hypothetical protein
MGTTSSTAVAFFYLFGFRSVQDAGSFNGAGGADGSCMLNANEQDWEANSFPFKFMPYVRGALTAVVCSRLEPYPLPDPACDLFRQCSVREGMQQCGHWYCLVYFF